MSSTNRVGNPLIRGTQITDRESVVEALKALLYGGDEDSARSTRALGWSTKEYEPEVEMIPWYEELQEIDAVISESIENAKLTPLPTASLLEKIDDMTEKLGTWFAAPAPIYQKRQLRHAFDEMAEVASLLRAGKINAGVAGQRYSDIMAEVEEVVDFTHFADMGS